MTDPAAIRTRRSQGEFALRLFVLSSAVFAAAGGLAYGLIHLAGEMVPGAPALPAAFWFSTLLLIGGSAALQRSLHHVRLERQRPFRRCLLAALGAAMLFVAVQSCGLWQLLQRQDPVEAETGVDAFVFVFTSLHGLHFTVAILFLAFVTLHALADRYDHEYHWGVTLCALFWHFLAVVWVAILLVLVLASLWAG